MRSIHVVFPVLCSATCDLATPSSTPLLPFPPLRLTRRTARKSRRMKTQFHCPQCSQLLSVDDDFPGMQVGCPACGQAVTAPAVFPITIFASPRALLAKYIRRGLTLVLLWVTWTFLSSFLITSGVELTLVSGAFIIPTVITLIASVTITIDYLRIRHTRYMIHRNKIETSSYLFSWLGIASNTINLTQLRQIQAFNNSYLDLWFFHCGSVLMTVSGDIADLHLTNIHYPTRVKQLIEHIAFGVTHDSPPSTQSFTDSAY